VSDDVDREHESCDIVGLLAGELSQDAFGHSARHVKSCRACSDQLTELAIAHGALTSAARAARGLDVAFGVDHRHDTRPAPAPGSQGDADAPPVALRRRRRRVLAAVAAVVALLALAVSVTRAMPGSSPPVIVHAALRALDARVVAAGTVTVAASGNTRQLTVETRHLSPPPAQSFYEVWLLDPATLKMLPMGVLAPSGTGDYSVKADIMAGYSAVDVSLQANNGDPAHSNTSVLRASYGVTT